MNTHNPLLGAHMSIAGGTPLAVQRALQAGCRVLQIFVKNSNRWKGKTLSDEEVEGFRKAWADSGEMAPSGLSQRVNSRISVGRGWGLTPQGGLWYFPVQSKRLFKMPRIDAPPST